MDEIETNCWSGPLKLENATVLSCRNLTFTAMIVNDFFSNYLKAS